MAKKTAPKKVAPRKTGRIKNTRIEKRNPDFENAGIDWSTAIKSEVQPPNKKFVRFVCEDEEGNQLMRIEMVDKLPKEGRAALGY